MNTKSLILFSSIFLGLFLSPLRAMERDDDKISLVPVKRPAKKVLATEVDGSLDDFIDYVSDALVETTGGIILLFDELLNDADNLIGSCIPGPGFSQTNRSGKFHDQQKKSRGSKLGKSFEKVCENGKDSSLAGHKPLPKNPIQKPKEEFTPAPLQQIFKVKNMKTKEVQLFSVPNGSLYEELYKKIDAYAAIDQKKQEEWENYGILFLYNCFDCTAYEYEKTPETYVEKGIPALYAPIRK